MSPRRPTPTPQGYYRVETAVVQLGLAKDEKDTTGRRWLRDGANREKDDPRGKPFPHSRLNGLLVFSDADLAEIYNMHRNAPSRRGRQRGSRVIGRTVIAPDEQTGSDLQSVA
ncbi:hypothetical protein ACFWPQ_02160 [Streptomyces sp. NPDC058464]|uniref:hypothetical protein n=1 Tax=Streptomyces sp. NPDC058464 TaxID=3346511 RepID=UPI00364BB063